MALIPISPSIQSLVCPVSNPNIRLTVPFVTGVSLVLLSTFTLLHCYCTLGRHFTYHLTIRDQHELVTSGLYNYVRHIIFDSWIMHSKCTSTHIREHFDDCWHTSVARNQEKLANIMCLREPICAVYDHYVVGMGIRSLCEEGAG